MHDKTPEKVLPTQFGYTKNGIGLTAGYANLIYCTITPLVGNLGILNQ